MPTYVYKCKKCGKEIEVFQNISEEPLKVCKSCGGDLKRIIFPAPIIFKGSGFYCTDYGKSKSSTSESVSTNSDKQKDDKNSVKSEDKKLNEK